MNILPLCNRKITFDTLHLVAWNLDFSLSLVQLDWLVTLNLETPLTFRFITWKRKNSFWRTQSLGNWHLDTGKLAPWDWVLRLELPFSFPLWNSSLLSPLTCAKPFFYCCQFEWIIQPRYRQPTRPSLSNESENHNSDHSWQFTFSQVTGTGETHHKMRFDSEWDLFNSIRIALGE